MLASGVRWVGAGARLQQGFALPAARASTVQHGARPLSAPAVLPYVGAGCSRTGILACRGFVGEGGSSSAGAYYDSDFTWESRIADGEAALARQRAELAAWLRDQQQQQGEGEQGRQQEQEQPLTQDGSWEAGDPLAAAPYDRGSWEGFHSQHSQARFFKERRYLLLEFLQLAVQDPPQHVVEVGCGCGSSLIPVLRANPTCRVTGCDISPTAVRLFEEAAARSGIDPARVSAFAFDAGAAASANGSGSPHGGGSGSLASPLAGLGADAALLIFTLSALHPDEMPTMLAHAWAALRPGGWLLFRDYGKWDMAQLRFHGSQMLGEDFYRRADGTLAYFFTPEGLTSLAEAAGFEVEEARYATTALRNRKSGAPEMKRVFVHAVLRKPAEG